MACRWHYETALDIDVRVHMLYGRQTGDIIWQYITFCKVLTAQIKIHGKTRTAIEETLRICRDKSRVGFCVQFGLVGI